MKQLLTFVLFTSLLSCDQTKNKYTNDNLANEFLTFDKSNHLQPVVKKTQFDTLHGWNFGRVLLEPITIATRQDDEKELSKRFSPGQKALYFIWHLDGKLTEKGFSQFYWDNYRKYIPPIIDGLKLIGDSSMSDIIIQADIEYLANKGDFPTHSIDVIEGFHPPLIVKKDYFQKQDSQYYKTRDNMIFHLEKYARRHPDEFVKLE